MILLSSVPERSQGASCDFADIGENYSKKVFPQHILTKTNVVLCLIMPSWIVPLAKTIHKKLLGLKSYRDRKLEQGQEVEVHVVFAQRVIDQGVFVVYSNLESAIHKLLIQEGERLIEDDVLPTSLKEIFTRSAQLRFRFPV